MHIKLKIYNTFFFPHWALTTGPALGYALARKNMPTIGPPVAPRMLYAIWRQ